MNPGCIRTQDQSVVDTLLKRVRSSAWFSHSECILIFLLNSDIPEEKSWAVTKIIEIRGDKDLGNKAVRKRVHPEQNFNAETLVDLIFWEEASEPIFTCDLSKDQLVEIRDKPLKVEYYCNHIQGIERAVKEVTEASG